MRIAMLHSAGYPAREGIGHYVEGLARCLVDRGHYVIVITRGGLRQVEHEHPDGYRIVAGPYVPIYPLHVHAQGIMLRHVFRSVGNDVDLFHLHSPLVPIPATRRPIVATFHTPMLPDTRALEAVGPTAHLARAQAPISVSLERQLLRRSRAITAVSPGVKRELESYAVRMRPVSVVGNATDPDFFVPGKYPQNRGPSLLYVGRIAHRKGLFDLLAAFRVLARHHAKLTLRLVGDGPLLAHLRKRVHRAGLLDRVVFLGHVADRQQLRSEYGRAAVYVQASHYEGLPTSLLEAMSCARPVVATNIPGHADVVTDRTNGRLAAPRSVPDLTRVIDQLLRDPHEAARLGSAARQAICERFSWRHVTSRFERVYEAAKS